MATALQFISEPELRKEITAATNKVEAYNGFSAWLRFGHDAIERNDPAEQEKIIKFNSLLANCVIFHTALDMTVVLRQLAEEGWTTAHNAPRQNGVRGGDRAAVLGIGGLGHLGVQFAVKPGLETVAIAQGTENEPLSARASAAHPPAPRGLSSNWVVWRPFGVP